MRSELVAAAAPAVRNRFLLVHVATTITRKFHRPTRDRLPETINSSLAALGEGKYLLCPGVALSNIQPDGIDAAPIWAVRAGVLDLDTYNGITGEAQCSYVKPAASEVSLADHHARFWEHWANVSIQPSSQQIDGLESETA